MTGSTIQPIPGRQSRNLVLVVGAGLCGATIARLLAEGGVDVQVLEQRNHVAGNAYDELDEYGIRVHRYGPHIFHTKNQRVWEFVSRFVVWMGYQHRVKARLWEGTLVPFPPNKRTLESVPREKLVDVFYRPYTQLMWGRPLEEVSPGVLNRVPIREDDNDLYFPNDPWQAMPMDGYTDFVRELLCHERIRYSTGVKVDPDYFDDYDRVFYSGSLDEIFECDEGWLPYRSLKFFHSIARTEPHETYQPVATINYTDGRYFTRRTEWKHFPGNYDPHPCYSKLTEEHPCDFMENDYERYYPVRDERSLDLYDRYAKRLAEKHPNVEPIGRCGSFVYIDMDQAINMGMQTALRYLNK